MSVDRHPAWCAAGSEVCEFSAELWQHRTTARTLVTDRGEVLQVSGEQFATFYTRTAAAPSVMLTLIGREQIRLTGRQALVLGEQLAGLVGLLGSFDLVAATPGVEPHPTWCAWASTADGEACRDSAFTWHHLSEMSEVLANDGTLIEVEGGMWVSDLASSDPAISLNLGGKEVTIIAAQAADLGRALTSTAVELEHHASAA